MKFKKCCFTILFIFSVFLLWHTSVNAGNLELQDLKYNVILNSDGTANVTEIWDIKIRDTNTLFKTFEIDSTYPGITDVSLIETTNGIRKNFSRIYQEKYHVNKDCFYALKNSKNQFEVAWGVSEDDSSARRTFEMSYTILDAVKNYADCSEFYWQFISIKSAIPAKRVTGTITLPTKVLNSDDLRVWAHGPLNGNIYKSSDTEVTFTVDNLNSNTMLEARVVTPTYVFANNDNISSLSELDFILDQEQGWADEANRKREAYLMGQRFLKILVISFFSITNVGGIILAIVLVKKLKKYKLELESAPNFKPTMPIKYFRDIPDDNSTPAQAAFLYYFKNSSFSAHISDVISATMLDLCMKKYLSFEVKGNKSNNITISLNTDLDSNLLSKDEKLIFDLLLKVSNTNTFTVKEFEKYCKKHSDSFMKIYNKIDNYAIDVLESKGKYSKSLISKHNHFFASGVGFVFLFIFSIFCMIANIVPSIMCAIYAFKLSNRYNTLTQKGVDEKEQWIGLKNYMQDFSMMEEKEVPELVLWEKFLVYATAFGISDKVLKQLKVVYPQFADSDYMISNGYSYLYWMSYGNFSNSFIHSINNSISSTYSSINYSSSSGSGGGFSGGGGFGGGGGRNGRKIILLLCFFINCVIIYLVYFSTNSLRCN